MKYQPRQLSHKSYISTKDAPVPSVEVIKNGNSFMFGVLIASLVVAGIGFTFSIVMVA